MRRCLVLLAIGLLAGLAALNSVATDLKCSAAGLSAIEHVSRMRSAWSLYRPFLGILDGMDTKSDRPLLPEVLRVSIEYRALDDAQRLRFEQRIDYVRDILGKLQQWLQSQTRDVSLRTFLDDLELDLAVVQNAPQKDVPQLSSWLIHSSWTFETSPLEMREELSEHTVATIESSALPLLEAGNGELEAWLRRQTLALSDALQRFVGSTSFASAIAQHIAIDIILAELLLACYKVRLNSVIS